MIEHVPFFQPDSVKAHTENNSVHYLKSNFNDRLINRGLWLPYSSDQSPLKRRLIGPHSWSSCCGEAKNLLPLLGVQPQFLGHLPHSLVIILCYPNSPIIHVFRLKFSCTSHLGACLHVQVDPGSIPPLQCHNHLSPHVSVHEIGEHQQL